jgi:hypothetical protein
MQKQILDACCGGRAFWFDKQNPNVVFADQRVMEPEIVGRGKDARVRKCLPDVVMDFRKMDVPDCTFQLVVFDPPHLFLGENSYMAKCYGSLDRQTWREDISKGFSECFRVLKINGILIFKWNECDVLLSEVLKCTEEKPLFGHPSGKSQKTHWLCFMKQESASCAQDSAPENTSEARLTAYNSAMPGEAPQICEAQTSA